MKLILRIFASSLLLLSFQLTFAQHIKLQWNPATEKAIRMQFSLAIAAGNLKLTPAEKETFLNSAIQKVKLKYPKGINGSMQEWQQTFDAVGKACVRESNYMVVKDWTATSQNSLKNKLDRMLPIELDSRTRGQLSDCLINDMKTQFPSGFSVNAGNGAKMDSTFTVLIAACMAKVNYKGYLRLDKESTLHFQKELIKYLPEEISADQKKLCIDCILKKMKQKYPDGISFSPETQNEYMELARQWAEDCLKSLKSQGLLKELN